MHNNHPPESPRPRRRLPSDAFVRLRLSEAPVRRHGVAGAAFTRAVRWLLETCRPHKSGKFVGTRVGYDPENHNGPCLLYRRSNAGARAPAAAEPSGPATTRPRPTKASSSGKRVGPVSPRMVPGKSARKSSAARAHAGRLRSVIGTENERRLASALGPGYRSLPDSEPMDVVHTDRSGVEHGIEVKTFLTNSRGRIHMRPAQQRRKEAWRRGRLTGIKDPRQRPDPSFDAAKGRVVHLIVIDHREAYHGSLHGKADFAKRKLDRLYYARGARPWQVKDMIGVDSVAGLRRLQSLSDDKYRAVHARFVGKMYPSGKPHPVVTNIVGVESLTQLRHLRDDRRRRLNTSVALLRRRRKRAAVLKKRVATARENLRTALARGDRQAARAAKAAFNGLDIALIVKNLEIEKSEAAVNLRRRKLRLTRTALRQKQAEVRRTRRGRVH